MHRKDLSSSDLKFKLWVFNEVQYYSRSSTLRLEKLDECGKVAIEYHKVPARVTQLQILTRHDATGLSTCFSLVEAQCAQLRETQTFFPRRRTALYRLCTTHPL